MGIKLTIKDYCDSCTDLKEVTCYEIADVFFYWCDECSEGESNE